MIAINATEVVDTLREVVTLKTLWAEFYKKPAAARTEARRKELKEREAKLLAKCQRHIHEYERIAGGEHGV
jgi:hypothetical protein